MSHRTRSAPARAPLNLLRGVVMGSADVVPGVSGGTVALILGFYRQLVVTVREAALAAGNLLRLRPRAAWDRLREIDWWFIVPLLVGIAAAVLTLARAIEYFLDNHPEAIAGLFFGLVAGSIPLAWAYLERPRPRHLLMAAVAAVATFALLGLRGGEIVDPSAGLVFGAGALAICAMILPGISGSLILLMIGLYDRVIEALNGREWGVILSFAAGAAIGLALFSTLLEHLLRRYHDPVMALLVGLLIGSLRVLWPWPEGTESAALGAPHTPWVAATALAVAGAALVVAAGVVARRLAPRA